MARTKSKTDIKKVMEKKGTTTRKKTSSTSKKKTEPKKKLVAEDEIKKKIEATGEIELVEKTVNRKKTVNEVADKIPVKKNKTKVSDTKELTKEEIVEQRKERNRKKYLNQQKKYQEGSKTKTKKKVEVEDEVIEKKVEESKKITTETPMIETPRTDDIVVVETLVKKEEIEISVEKKENNDRKEKRKTNRKSDHFTQTISNIKTKSVDKINVVKEKTTDRNIPIGKTKEEKQKRSKRFIKEAWVYAIILTLVDVGCIYLFDYFNFLRLFDVKYLNIIVTILLVLIFNFFIAFMVDYLVTKVWLKSKRKKKDGEQNGDSGVNEEEYREDIKDKE